MSTRDQSAPRQPSSSERNSASSAIAGSRGRVGRRGLIKAATVTVAGVVAASDYVRPSVRPLEESLDVSQPLATSGRPSETVEARTRERRHGHEGQADG